MALLLVSSEGRLLVAIARAVTSTEFEDLPSEVLLAAKRIALDDFGAMLGGHSDSVVATLVSDVQQTGGGSATVLAPPWPCTSAVDAALINGIAGTVADFDGGYRLAPSHGGMYCLPAGLAVGEELHRSGRKLVTSLVLGYELGARLAEATSLRERMHPHGLWAVPAAAACVAKLEGLDEALTERALAIAASLTIGTSYRCAFEGATVRNAWAGWSGAAGITAVRLAKAGMTGLGDAFEDTFGRLYGRFDSDAVMAMWGEPYAVTRHYHKRYACEGHCQVAVEVLEGLQKTHRFDPGDVDRIDVETYEVAALRSRVQVDNALAAKYSIPFALATLLVTGNAGPDAFGRAALNDPQIKELATRVGVVEDPALSGDDRRWRPARVRVRLLNGSSFEGIGTNPPGDYRRPTETTELCRKFEEMAVGVAGNIKARQLETVLLSLDEQQDVGDIGQLLRG